MEDFNHALFLSLNAPEHPSTLLLAIATFFAHKKQNFSRPIFMPRLSQA